MNSERPDNLYKFLNELSAERADSIKLQLEKQKKRRQKTHLDKMCRELGRQNKETGGWT